LIFRKRLCIAGRFPQNTHRTQAIYMQQMWLTVATKANKCKVRPTGLTLYADPSCSTKEVRYPFP
jgi:hypothetical protein